MEGVRDRISVSEDNEGYGLKRIMEGLGKTENRKQKYVLQQSFQSPI